MKNVICAIGKMFLAMCLLPVIMLFISILIGLLGIMVSFPTLFFPIIIIFGIISLPGILVGMLMKGSSKREKK